MRGSNGTDVSRYVAWKEKTDDDANSEEEDVPRGDLMPDVQCSRARGPARENRYRITLPGVEVERLLYRTRSRILVPEDELCIITYRSAGLGWLSGNCHVVGVTVLAATGRMARGASAEA